MISCDAIMSQTETTVLTQHTTPNHRPTTTESTPSSVDFSHHVTQQLNAQHPLTSVLQSSDLTDLVQKTCVEHTQLTCPIQVQDLPKSTKKVKINTEHGHFLGQQRAKTAIETAIHLPDGYHVVAIGTAGLGKRTMIQRLLRQYGSQRPAPSDWVYVNHFHQPRYPIALRLNAGEAVKFQKVMHDLWLHVHKQLQTKFNSDSYHRRIDSLKEQGNRQQQDELLSLSQESLDLGLKLTHKEDEHYFVPLNPQAPQQELSQQEVDALDHATRLEIANHIRQMEKKLARLGHTFQRIEQQTQDQILAYNQSLADKILQPKLKSILQKFAHIDGLSAYLDAYRADIIEHIELILLAEDDDFRPSMLSRIPARYQVNIVASHKANQTAPIIFEDFPTYSQLLGHVEQMTRMGSILTDFSLIRAGALHQANGGFLILQAEQLLEHPYAWQGLKRALQSRQLKLAALEQLLTLTGSISIEPQAIPLDVKVILLAEEQTYHELLEYDADFQRLFKIRADFSDSLIRNAETEQQYIEFIADFVRHEQFTDIDATGLAALLTLSSRQAESQHDLSLHASRLGDLLREANHYAKGHSLITAQHIQQAEQQRQYRLAYLKELYWQDYQRAHILINTQGAVIGQINALTVVDYAGSEFGLPSRVTATVAQGEGDVLDIERTVELGGALHAKGVLIMSSYLKAYFGHSQHLAFSASIAHEQNYQAIDGDSATVAEVCALISAMSGLAIDQSWAVTGSMNQFGEVQAIGGINSKIEGFFDLCQLQGLTGQQGVIIPQSNVQHLMLREDVITAVSEKRFHIHAICHIEEALSLLMATPVGKLDEKLRYHKGSIFARVMKQLDRWQAIADGDVEPAKPKKKKAKKKKVPNTEQNATDS